MKKTLLYVLIATQVFTGCIPRAWASPETEALDKAIETATQLRDDLKKNYYPHLVSTTQNAIHTQYLYMFWDYVAIRDVLTSKAQTGLARMSKIRQEFGEHRAKLFIENANWDESATSAFARVAHAQGIAIEAGQVQADAKTLVLNWEQVCSKKNRDQLLGYVNPLTYMKLIEIDAPAAPEPHIEVGVQVTTDFDGNYKNSSAGGQEGEPQDPEDAILAVAAGVATIPPYGWIVAIVLVVIWALIKFGPYMDEVYKLADKESKLAELKKEIRQIQFEAMERVGAEAPGMIDKACAETFPKEDGKLLYRDIFNDYAKQSSEALVSLKTQSQEIISAYQDRYRNLTEIYYPAVKKNYVSLVDLRMAQAEKVERQIDLMIQNNFQWLFTRYQKAKSGAGPSLWNAQYDIWSATLSADAWFRTENGFSLTPGTPAQETPSQFGNSWNTIGPKMKRIFE